MNFLYSFFAMFSALLKDEAGTLSYTQITAITNKLIKKKVTNGVFSSQAVLKRFRKNQEVEDGGERIVCPLYTLDDTGTTGGFYDSRDPLTLDEYDGISASEHLWKYIYESIVIYKADIAKNSGVNGILKLIAKKVMQGELSLKQKLIKGLLSDGTTSTGTLSSKQFVGLQAVIKSTGSYGSIAPSDLATWVSTVDDNGGSLRALTEAMIQKNFDSAVEDEIGGPTLGMYDKNVFSKHKGLLVGYQRAGNDSSLDGFGHGKNSLRYNGIDYLVENQMPANTLFHVDENHFKLHVHKDHNMRRQSIKDLETSDALLERIFLYGNTAASERKFHSRINDISV